LSKGKRLLKNKGEKKDMAPKRTGGGNLVVPRGGGHRGDAKPWVGVGTEGVRASSSIIKEKRSDARGGEAGLHTASGIEGPNSVIWKTRTDRGRGETGRVKRRNCKDINQ